MESHQAKFKCSLEWLAGVAGGCADCGLNPVTLGPLYQPYSAADKLKSKVVDILTNPVIYCTVYNSLLSPEEPVSSTSFWPLIQHLARRGVYVMEDDDSPLSHTALSAKSPFKENAHIALIDGLMRGYSSSLGIRERVVKAVRRISGLSASKELPSSTEEALLLWLNKTSEAVCKQHHYLVQRLLSETNPSKRRQNRLKLMSEPGPVAIPRSSDLTTAVAHGQCLPAVVLHYFPSSFNWSDFNFRADLLTEEEVMHNLHRVRLACTSFLPAPSLHVPPELLVFWGSSSDLLLDNVTAMIALLFDHLEPVHEKTFKTSPLSSSSFPCFSASTAKKQAAGSSKEEKASKVPSMPVSKLPKISQRSHSMLNLSSASATEAPSIQPHQHTQHHLPPQPLSAIARKHFNTGPFASLSETMMADSTQSLHTGRQMMFVAPIKSSHGILNQTLMSSLRTKKLQQQHLISASVDNLVTLTSDNERGQTLDSSELSSTLKLEAPPTASQSTTSQLTPFSEEVDHSIAGQQTRPGSSSRQSPRIKFIRNTSHQQPQPITSAHLPQASAGETSTLQPSSGTTAEHVDLSATGGQSGGIKFFVDLDQVSSQDHPDTHASALHSSYTLEKSMLSDRRGTRPSSARREEGTIERTAAVTDEPHTLSQTSLFPEDGVHCLRVCDSDSDEPERVPTPPLDPDKLLLRMKLRTQMRDITQQSMEEEEELQARKSEMLMRVFFAWSQEQQQPNTQGQGEEIKVDKRKRMPNQDTPTYRHSELKPQALKFPSSVATVEKSRALISQDFASKPSTAGGSVVASEASCHEELASSSPAVVEYAGLGVPLFSQPDPDAATGELVTDHHDPHKQRKQELIKARLQERDRQRREAAKSRKREQQAHRRIMSATITIDHTSDNGGALAASSSSSIGTTFSGDHKTAVPVHTGPECYVRPHVVTNKKLIRNALIFVCLAGEANITTKQRALAELDSSRASHFMILFRNTLGCKFKAFYGYQPEDDKITRIFGTGPKVIGISMVTKFFKYNSGGKEFRPVHSRQFSIFIDALTIHDHCWGKKR